MGSSFARFQVNVLKMALLLDLGNLPYYLAKFIKDEEIISNLYMTINIKMEEIISKTPLGVSNTDEYLNCILSLYNNNIISDYNISSMYISFSSLKYVMKLYDSVYIPYMHEISLKSRANVFTNYLSNLYNIMIDKNKIDYSTLLRNSNIGKREDFNEAIETMKESGALLEYKGKGKTKPSRVFVYNPPSYKRFKFNVDYENVEEQGYIRLYPKKDKPQPAAEDIQEPKPSYTTPTFATNIESSIPMFEASKKEVLNSTNLNGFVSMVRKGHPDISKEDIKSYLIHIGKLSSNGDKSCIICGKPGKHKSTRTIDRNTEVIEWRCDKCYEVYSMGQEVQS